MLERVDVMNDEAANALLKTLEEPPSYVVLLLLTNRPTQVLPTIASRCQAVRFDPPTTTQLAQRLEHQGFAPDTAEAAARLSLGDGEKAIRLATGDGLKLRQAAEATPGRRSTARSDEKPWGDLLDRAKQARPGREVRGGAAAQGGAAVPAQEGAQAPRDGVHGTGRRADRRAATQALDHALQLVGLWYRDLTVLPANAPELAFHSDRLGTLQQDAGRPNLHGPRNSSTTRARA